MEIGLTFKDDAEREEVLGTLAIGLRLEGVTLAEAEEKVKVFIKQQLERYLTAGLVRGHRRESPVAEIAAKKVRIEKALPNAAREKARDLLK